jgi:hypothetical protein
MQQHKMQKCSMVHDAAVDIKPASHLMMAACLDGRDVAEHRLVRLQQFCSVDGMAVASACITPWDGALQCAVGANDLEALLRDSSGSNLKAGVRSSGVVCPALGDCFLLDAERPSAELGACQRGFYSHWLFMGGEIDGVPTAGMSLGPWLADAGYQITGGSIRFGSPLVLSALAAQLAECSGILVPPYQADGSYSYKPSTMQLRICTIQPRTPWQRMPGTSKAPYWRAGFGGVERVYRATTGWCLRATEHFSAGDLVIGFRAPNRATAAEWDATCDRLGWPHDAGVEHESFVYYDDDMPPLLEYCCAEAAPKQFVWQGPFPPGVAPVQPPPSIPDWYFLDHRTVDPTLKLRPQLIKQMTGGRLVRTALRPSPLRGTARAPLHVAEPNP